MDGVWKSTELGEEFGAEHDVHIHAPAPFPFVMEIDFSSLLSPPVCVRASQFLFTVPCRHLQSFAAGQLCLEEINKLPYVLKLVHYNKSDVICLVSRLQLSVQMINFCLRVESDNAGLWSASCMKWALMKRWW